METLLTKDKSFKAAHIHHGDDFKNHVSQLVDIVDHCTAAKIIAESIGEPFLVYMLSMTVQAAIAEMKPKTASEKKR